MSNPTVDQYITKRLEYLDRLIYHHDCNIPEPNFQEQTECHEAHGERQALRKIQELLGEPTVIEDSGLTNITVTSGFGHNTQQPFVEMTIRRADWTTQMSPAMARELALNLLAAADAAESDGFVVGFFRDHIGLEMSHVAGLLMEFRDYREKRQESSNK